MRGAFADQLNQSPPPGIHQTGGIRGGSSPGCRTNLGRSVAVKRPGVGIGGWVGVAVGGIDVAVGGIGVAVGGIDVAVGGGNVGVGEGLAQPASLLRG